MTKQAQLQKRLRMRMKDLMYMKKYITDGSIGTVEQMIFTLQRDLTRDYALLLEVEKERERKAA